MRKLDSRTQEALDRLKAIFDAETIRFQDSEGRTFPHPLKGTEPDSMDLFLVYIDPEARRQFRHHVGIQETRRFA